MTDPEITPPPEKPKPRAVEFSDDIFDTICERMMGGEWLRAICDNDTQMPTRQTFLRWIEKDTGRQEKYARASRAMVDYWAEELLEIPKETEKDTIIDAKGRRRCNMEWVANKRLLSENLRFLMAKIYPKRYGDRLPESEGAKDADAERIQVSWEKPFNRIDLVGVRPGDASVSDLMRTIDGRTRGLNREIISPIHDDNGNIINANDASALRKRILQLEEKLGVRKDETPPKLITYDPGPLPSRIEGEIVLKLVDVIKQNVPRADQRSPEEVLDEVLAECAKALQAKYGKADAAA